MSTVHESPPEAWLLPDVPVLVVFAVLVVVWSVLNFLNSRRLR